MCKWFSRLELGLQLLYRHARDFSVSLSQWKQYTLSWSMRLRYIFFHVRESNRFTFYLMKEPAEFMLFILMFWPLLLKHPNYMPFVLGGTVNKILRLNDTPDSCTTYPVPSSRFTDIKCVQLNVPHDSRPSLAL